MKPLLYFVVAAVMGLVGYTAGRWQQRESVISLLKAAAGADGFGGGAQIRHAVIGNITNVTIAPDHVAVSGTKGTRQFWP